MSGSLQEFLVQATRKAAEEIQAALLHVPEDKRDWKPMDQARSALDQVAEVAILTGHTADLIKNGSWTLSEDFNGYVQAKAELSKEWTGIQALLKTNIDKLVEAIQTAPEADLDKSLDMPWGPMSLVQIMAYPHWNMTYHLGQINYIASMLGKL